MPALGETPLLPSGRSHLILAPLSQHATKGQLAGAEQFSHVQPPGEFPVHARDPGSSHDLRNAVGGRLGHSGLAHHA